MKTINNKTFKQIPGFDGYYCSYDGEVYSEKTNRILKPNFNTGTVSYPTLCLYSNGKNNCVMIHKLVALTWIPLPKDYTIEGVLGNWLSHNLIADHIDGDKRNFSASNLRWCSPFENSNFNNFDREKRVEALKGNQNAKNKRTPKNVGEVRYIYCYNGKEYNIKSLCKELNCAKSKITESFRSNLGLVRAGKLTRIPTLTKSYKERLLAELHELLVKVGDDYSEDNPDVIRMNEILTIIAENSKER